MLSFIIPAHNEEQHLPATLAAISTSADATGQPYEIVVVDDSSTDRTAEIALTAAARLVSVQHRQISATRNAGARAARGEILFFVDADTQPTPAAVQAGLDALRSGAVGGGCVFTFDGVLPLWARCLYPLAVLGARTLHLVGGCFLFCTRAAFEAVGGFSEKYFAAEEAAFIRALQRHGRFVIPRPTVVTSGRKLRAHSARELLGIAWNWAVRGPRHFQKRDGLEIWYGERTPDRLD